MNAMITRYKKTALLIAVIAAIGMSSVLSAGCSACAAAAAIRQSIKDAQAAALAGGKKALETELDEVPAERAMREELADPCNPAFPSCDFCGNCNLNDKLQVLFNCCVNTNQQVRHQGHEAKKCCKRLHHEIDEVGALVTGSGSVTDTTISVIDSNIGDPATTVTSLQDCGIDVLGFVNSNDVDVLTWLKTIYVLLYQVFSCTCCT
ncbi:MAG TPA: hypothetical protein VHX42_03895 [Candidatus Babeliales bacterium]|jgi:hypothetical protein|nr:hypothetical protein [Candidatus Babeliales bacterium]